MIALTNEYSNFMLILLLLFQVTNKKRCHYIAMMGSSCKLGGASMAPGDVRERTRVMKEVCESRGEGGVREEFRMCLPPLRCSAIEWNICLVIIVG